MPRADLHNALVIDRETYRASQVDPSLLDPVVRPVGGLPGLARPFAVVRVYQGPQGVYAEHFELANRAGDVLHRAPVQPITLSGEMFEDRFVDTLSDVLLAGADELTATFYVDDEQVGSVPVFIESARGGDPRVAAEETFKQALKKGTILWVQVPRPAARGRGSNGGGSDTRPVWFVFDDGKVFVLTGPTEQRVPGLTEAREVTLIARAKDERSQVSAVPATVRVIPTDDDEWEQRAKAALPKRLNLPDGQEAIERWRQHCTLVELTPRFRDERAAAEAAAAGPAATAPAAGTAPAQAAPAAASGDGGDDIHVEAEVDQEVYDRLIGEGKSERLARAKAKASYVRKEKARIRAEREATVS